MGDLKPADRAKLNDLAADLTDMGIPADDAADFALWFLGPREVLPWRARLANWPDEWRNRWGRLANEKVDQGEPWLVAELESFLELEPLCLARGLPEEERGATPRMVRRGRKPAEGQGEFEGMDEGETGTYGDH